MGEETTRQAKLRGSGTPVTDESAESLTWAQRITKQYGGQFMIPVERVARDYFNMNTEPFMRKVAAGEIRFPIVRMYDDSQKAAKAIYVNDLAEYLERRHALAMKEFHALYD